jgi:hypothetical protein
MGPIDSNQHLVESLGQPVKQRFPHFPRSELGMVQKPKRPLELTSTGFLFI